MPETLTDAQKVLRNDTGKRIAAALETLASAVEPSTVIAPEYDATQTYAVGDLVLYRDVLYRCTTAITMPEAWTAAHWTATSVSNEYRPATEQDVIDAGKETAGLGLTGASVGDLVRVKTVDANGKPTSWNHVPLCDIVTNENLLDNWYFVGGGSQLGDGVFPINQQGQATYVTQGPCIDQWRMRGSDNGSVAVASVGVVITINDNSGAGTSYKSLDQLLDKNLLLGKQVTLSCIISEYANTGVERLQLGIWAANNVTAHSEPVGVVAITGPGLYQVTINIPSEISYTYIKCAIFMANAAEVHGAASVKVEAVKLELGSYQTLAHNEGTNESPNWVLNEIPNYSEELVKCNVADGKTVEYTDRFLVLESTYEYARDLTWTAIGGGIAYSAKMQFTFNGATATTVPGYRAVAATIARFSIYKPEYQWVPYIQYNTGEVCIYSAVGENITDFQASSHISVRAVFEKT